MDNFEKIPNKRFFAIAFASLFKIILLVGIIGWVAGGYLLIAEDLENQVRKISDQLRCPTCQSMSVKDSEAGLSVNMKNKVRDLLKEGKSEEEVLDYFVKRYGEWILRSPQKKGFNLFLWVLPAVLLIIAGSWLGWALYKKTKVAEIKTAQPLSKKEASQIEKDLENFSTE